MTTLYDCHCHLHSQEFDADREAVIERARSAGVRRALVVAEDLGDAHRALEVCEAHADFLVPAVGVHPDRVGEVDDSEVNAVVELARTHRDRLGAIGEVGLDFRPCWDDNVRARQREILDVMITLAAELELPLSVHSRSAGRHALAQLRARGAERVCMHGFDGRATYAEEGVAAGYLFSIPPSLVRSRVKQKLVARLPVSAILLESDAPVLGPDAEERNEPKNLDVTLAALAEAKNEPVTSLAATVAAGTVRLFPRLVA